MQSIGAVLGDKLKPVDFRDPEYIERVLVDLVPTHVAVEAVQTLTADQLGHVEGSTAWRRLSEEVLKAQTLLERCDQRDVIAAERPEGCWCLGLGGKRRRWAGADESVFNETCTCPEGVAAAEHKAAVHARTAALMVKIQQDRLFGNAKVPSRFKDCTIESYPVSPQTQAALAEVREWLEGPAGAGEGSAEMRRWADRRKKSILLHGLYGVGKTGLAVGILRHELEIEGGGLFFTVPSLLDCIKRTYAPNPIANEHDVVEAVKNAPFLVLDDLGAERVTEWVREKLFTIINHRHDEDLPTVFTSNLSIAELGEHIGERTTWRIHEMATVIRVEGPNLRAKGAA